MAAGLPRLHLLAALLVMAVWGSNFVIIRIVAPKTVSTAKEKIFMVDAVKIWSLLYPRELLRAICIAVKSWLTS